MLPFIRKRNSAKSCLARGGKEREDEREKCGVGYEKGEGIPLSSQVPIACCIVQNAIYVPLPCAPALLAYSGSHSARALNGASTTGNGTRTSSRPGSEHCNQHARHMRT